MTTPTEFNLLAELVTSGRPGDYFTQEPTKELRVKSTYVFKESVAGPEDSRAASMDIITTAFFNESHHGKNVPVYRSNFTRGGRAVKSGASYSRIMSNAASAGLPESIHHGEVGRYAASALTSRHKQAMSAYHESLGAPVSA